MTLDEIIEQINQLRAEGIWLIRGATDATLEYQVKLPEISRPFGRHASEDLAKNISLSTSLKLDITDAGILVIIRLPPDDGAPGIETR